MKSSAVLTTFLVSYAYALGDAEFWCGNTCPKDVGTKDDCQAAIDSINVDGENDGDLKSAWSFGGCKVDFFPNAQPPKSMSNQVTQDYAQQLLDHCGADSAGGDGVGGVAYKASDLQGGCVCIHSTEMNDVCDCGFYEQGFGDCMDGYEIGT